MPELDDELLFGDGAGGDDRDDDRESRDDDDGERDEDGEGEGEERTDLEGQFDEEGEERSAKPAAKKVDGDGGKRDSKTVTLSAKEYREMQQRIREKETEEAYWRGKAEAKGRRGADDDDGDEDPAPSRTTGKKAAAAVEDEDDEDLLDKISKQGTKALRGAGFVRLSEVESLIEERATAIARREAGSTVKQATDALHSDAQLIRQYPELNDPKSEFSRRVGEEVRELVAADKSLAKSPAVIAMAAKIVKTQVDAEGKSKRGVDADRERRISKQTPSGGRRADADEPYMSPMQRQMLGPMLRGLGLSEKAYREEVARSGRGRR